MAGKPKTATKRAHDQILGVFRRLDPERRHRPEMNAAAVSAEMVYYASPAVPAVPDLNARAQGREDARGEA